MTIARRAFVKSAGLAAVSPLLLSGAQTSAATSVSDPFKDLTPMTAGIVPIDSSDFLRRQDRARAMMATQGIDALFLSGSNNLTYFAGINMGAGDRLFAMFLPQKGKPVFICPAFEAERAKERMRWGQENIRVWEEHEDPFKMGAQFLTDMGYNKGCIGVDGNLPYWYYDHLAKALPLARFQTAETVTLELRLIKEPKEIALTRRAVEITLAAYKAAFHTMHANMTQAELSQAH